MTTTSATENGSAPATATITVAKAAHGCRNCASLVKSVTYWESQAKQAIKKRDDLDKTLLTLDGGIGHWRRVSKELSILLFERRSDDANRVAQLYRAAAEREDEVERRIQRARDVLWDLRKLVGVDAPIGQEIHKVWATL